MHQNQWLAAIEDLKVKDLEETVVPRVAREYEKSEFSYQFWNHPREKAPRSLGKGPSMDGEESFSMWRILSRWDQNRSHHSPIHDCGTAKTPQASQSSATGEPNVIDRVVEVIV